MLLITWRAWRWGQGLGLGATRDGSGGHGDAESRQGTQVDECQEQLGSRQQVRGLGGPMLLGCHPFLAALGKKVGQ